MPDGDVCITKMLLLPIKFMIHYNHIIMARITSYLLFFGVIIPLLLVVYDQFLGPPKHFKETPLGIY